MSTQSYPWFRFAHVEYLLNPVITGLSLAAQGANTRLMAYAARELPFGTLPNNEKDLITMSGAKSVKEYQKILSELMDRVWFVGDDRLFCPLMNVESVPVAQESKQDSEDDKKGMTNAERQAAYRARIKAEEEALRNAQENNEVTDSNVTRNNEVTERNGCSNGSVTERNVTSNAAVTDSNVTHRNEMGGRGEDLDSELKQDLELKQEVKNSLSPSANEKKSTRSQNFFDDELKPNLKMLNDKFIGEVVVTQALIDSQLFVFNAHYETQQLTDNQRLAKWVSWIKRKIVDEKISANKSQKITRPPKEKIFGNVNDDFPIVNHRMLTPEEIAANKEKLNDLPF